MPLAETPSPDVRPLPRRQAPFLAHLIATAQQLPQARERRRAEPNEAIAAYTATLARSPGR